jgi:signal transduction histidine kinase
MAADGKKTPERDQTDDSLRTERQNTDRALLDKRAAVAEDADQVLQLARETADAVLDVARDKADEQLDPSSLGAKRDEAITQERVLEDEALRDARASADEILRLERKEADAALARLLPLERDKTDRHLVSERARSDDALSNRDEFLSIVSHDLRNLLGGIVISADLMAKSAPVGEAGRETLRGTERIQRYSARMNRLIGDLLDVVSIDAGKLAITADVGDATALIGEAVDTFQPTASAKGVVLEAQRPDCPLLAAFDHERMLQVLANLITNAVKFTPAGGTVTVRGELARGDVNEVRLSVTDTGAGIPGHLLEVVFDRFCQIGKNDRRGVGIGLYIARSIVDAHGGRIWAESEVGKGSTFVFTLPRARRHQETPLPPAAAERAPT